MRSSKSLSRRSSAKLGRWLGSCLLASGTASAAVYNFYFNPEPTPKEVAAKPETGLSKETPSVDVKKSGPNLVESEIDETIPEGLPSEAPVAQVVESSSRAASPSTSVAPLPLSSEAKNRKKRFRMALVGTGESSENLDWGGSGTHWAQGFGGGVSLSFLPSRHFGLTFFGGMANRSSQAYGGSFYGGAELELLPFRLSLFGIEDFLELGVTSGASTISAATSNIGTIHLGVRTNFNFGADDFFLTAGGRGNYGYFLADLGAGWRF